MTEDRLAEFQREKCGCNDGNVCLWCMEFHNELLVTELKAARTEIERLRTALRNIHDNVTSAQDIAYLAIDGEPTVGEYIEEVLGDWE